MRNTTGRKSQVRLTRRQYRIFAEHAKEVGVGLFVSTTDRLGAWGVISPLAMPIHDDVTQDRPKLDEHCQIGIADAINLDAFYTAGKGRPELDWSALQPEEIYPFLMQHELGHRLDNFDFFDVMTIKDPEAREQCRRYVGYVNEVLADRYAWGQIRPGEAIPKTEIGKQHEERLETAFSLLRQHGRHTSTYRRRSIPAGQYRSIPDWMLATPELAAFIGPHVSSHLLGERCQHHRNNEWRGRA